MRRLLLAAMLILAAVPVAGEKLVSTLANQQVLITSSFDGAVVSMFGSIEAETPGEDLSGPYNVIVIITGPLQDRVARIKTNRFGIWTNTDDVTFQHFPSFYAVVSSGRLDSIADPSVLQQFTVPLLDQARHAAQTDGLKGERFSQELVRLMQEEGHFVLREDGIRFLSPTAYAVNVILPSDVANGPFIVRTLVLKDGQLVADNSAGFSVRKSGFENFVFTASRQQPLLYGIVCVILALGTGWLAGVVFRR